MKKLKYFGLILIILGLVSIPKITNSEEMEFSIEPIYSQHQIEQGLGYYYLKTKPDETQKIEVSLRNLTEETIRVQMYAEDAFTGINGGLAYGVDGQEGFTQDETLINPVSSLIKADQEVVELKGREEKVVTFSVSPTKEHYDGIKLGQLVFQLETDEDAPGLKDVYRYGVSVILSESGDEYDNGELASLALTEVKATIKRGKRMVTANLQNPTPLRIINLEMDGVIKEKGKSEIVKQTKMSNFQFAPNSNVDYEIDWGLADLKAGEYTFELVASNDYDDVKLQQDFRITGDQAKKINEDSAFRIKTPNWVKIVTIINGFFVVALTIYLIIRNKNWERLSKKKRRQRPKNKKVKGQ